MHGGSKHCDVQVLTPELGGSTVYLSPTTPIDEALYNALYLAGPAPSPAAAAG